MSDKASYYATWTKIDQEPIGNPYNFWGSDNRNVGNIVEYHNKLGEFVLRYTDFWTLPYPSTDFRVTMVCRSLHDAKCMGDIVSMNFRKYVDKDSK